MFLEPSSYIPKHHHLESNFRALRLARTLRSLPFILPRISSADFATDRITVTMVNTRSGRGQTNAVTPRPTPAVGTIQVVVPRPRQQANSSQPRDAPRYPQWEYTYKDGCKYMWHGKLADSQMLQDARRMYGFKIRLRAGCKCYG